MNGKDITILIIIILIIILALRPTIKHMLGKGDCCGGGSIPIIEDKKLHNPIIGTKIIVIEGMTCEHCVNKVKQAINEIDGASAIVSLHEKVARVRFDREIEDNVFVCAISKAGYTVKNIK